MRGISRRALLALTGGVVALAALGRTLVRGTPPESQVLSPSIPAPEQGGTAVDLSVRWLHVEPRVKPIGRDAGLVAAWAVDEGSGYAFADVAGAGHTLHISGSDWNTTESGLLGAIHRAGRRGGAVFLNGARWLAAPPTDELALDQRGLTVTAWVSVLALPAGDATIVRLGDGATLALDDRGRVTWDVATSDGKRHVVRSAGTLGSGWRFVAATVDPSTGRMNLWLDDELSGHLTVHGMQVPGPITVSAQLGRGLHGLLDETTLHRGALTAATVQRIRRLGLPRVFTQTSETIDEPAQVFTRCKGSDPVPHPVGASAVVNLRFADTLMSEQGDAPRSQPDALFVPSAFGCGWYARNGHADYASPLKGTDGTFEAWYEPIRDPADPRRLSAKVVFTATAPTGRSRLTLSTHAGAWRIDATDASGRVTTAHGPVQTFPAGRLAHIAVAWGRFGDQGGIRLLADGHPVAFLTVPLGSTTYDGTLRVGGTDPAPAYLVFTDVRVSNATLLWGDVCPRGQASTEGAGLDLRDFFRRPVGVSPFWWRQGAGDPAWTIGRRSWQHPGDVGDDPDANLAVFQRTGNGVRPLFHPDAYGHASAIEAGVSVETVRDGWAGVFVQSSGPTEAFSGLTFMLNTARNQLRLARYDAGRVVAQRTVTYDFSLQPKSVYEMTLSAPGRTGDGVYRGFVDHNNMVSMHPGEDDPAEGHAGLVTDGTAASFSAVHFTALTPATPTSRLVRVAEVPYGSAGFLEAADLVPFPWRKRRGRVPWAHTSKNPEPPGNIAGGDTDTPQRPIPSAYWRSEDSANSDLIVVDGVVWYLMRGNPRIDGTHGSARVGMLHTPAERFDAVHFTDPNQHTHRDQGGPWLLVGGSLDGSRANERLPTLNAPSSAYAGTGRLTFFGRVRSDTGGPTDGTVYARFDMGAQSWQSPQTAKVDWSDGEAGTPRMHGSPELVALRRPDSDEYHGVVLQQLGDYGSSAMGTALCDHLTTGVPQLEEGSPIRRSLERQNGATIYGFRVMFDNGIYYLHYNEGPQVPDWPAYFVLATALDPYAGPWVRNEDTNLPSATYFTRGSELEPDNGAIWQGTMVKFRGHYYLYYENYHAIGDVDVPYQYYDNPQAGSRVGLATA